MANSILSQIAQGGTDPVGAFQRGQGIRSNILGQQLQRQQLETGRLNPQIKALELETAKTKGEIASQDLFQGADANAMQNSAVALAMALGMPDEDQKKFLALENDKLPQGSKYRNLMESMSATDDPVKRNARIIQMLDVFKDVGVMGRKTRGKTPEQIERELKVKEGRVALGEAELAYKKKKGPKASPLMRKIEERQALLDQGLTEDDFEIQAFDRDLLGAKMADFTQEDIDTVAGVYVLTGKMPPLGRGDAATALRSDIVKSATQQLQGGVEGDPELTPADAALRMLGETSDTKAIQGSLNFLDKQVSSMGSFVTNLNSQIDKVAELSKDLDTFDTRLLNVPLRTLRGRIMGSPLQAKYDMYLAEISNEIGKLASGATASIAELSVGAQDKWGKIHDPALKVGDMLELLGETKNAANFRLQSVQDQLDATRQRMRRGRTLPGSSTGQTSTSKIEFLGFE